VQKKIKCVTDQEARVQLGSHSLKIKDGHVTKSIKCVGDPCEIRIHAVAGLVAYAARLEESLQGATVELERPPCQACAVLLSSAKVGNIIVKHCDDRDQPEMQLLAVVARTEIVP
jgi:deoxycytidylate deaminase